MEQLAINFGTSEDWGYAISQAIGTTGANDVTVVYLARLVEATGAKTVDADFTLKLRAIKQEITVTANGQEQSAFEAFQTVTTVDSLDLAAKSQTSLGEVLDNSPGVAKRSFGQALFVSIEDATGRIQVYLRKDQLPAERFALARSLGTYEPSIGPASSARNRRSKATRDGSRIGPSCGETTCGSGDAVPACNSVRSRGIAPPHPPSHAEAARAHARRARWFTEARRDSDPAAGASGAARA
mgnify:CR=1 FL=1